MARRLVEIIHMVRSLDLKKPPSIAESIDWARALLLLGADDIDQAVLERTMSIIVKHRTDLDVVAERVGVKLGRWQSSRARRQSGLNAGPLRRHARTRRAARLRRRGCSSWPTSCAPRAWRWAPPSCSTPSRRSASVSWTSQEDFREALAATLAKSQEDRRVLRRACSTASSSAPWSARPWSAGLTERALRRAASGIDLEDLRERIRDAIRAGLRRRDARPGAARDRWPSGARARAPA